MQENTMAGTYLYYVTTKNGIIVLTVVIIYDQMKEIEKAILNIQLSII